MPYQTFETKNATEGVHVILQYVAEINQYFFPFMLAMIWLIICMGTYNARQNQDLSGDFVISGTVASYITTILAFTLSLIPNVINTTVVIISIGIALGFTIQLWVQSKT